MHIGNWSDYKTMMQEPMKLSPDKTIGFIALLLAGVAVLGLVFITLFYSLNPDNPFGTLNDYCVALGGILSGMLALAMFPLHHSSAPRLSWLALLSALLGACFASVGSWLVVTSRTGWFLAGLVSTFGYALIGLWLLSVNISIRKQADFSRRLSTFGILTGIGMAIGLSVIPAIFARVDSLESAPWYAVSGLVGGGMSWNILYTIWCIWFGRLIVSNRVGA